MRKRLFIIAFAASCCMILWADQLPMGNWRTHLAYNSITRVAIGSEQIFAISDGALFSVSKEDEQIDVYSKITGLSDNNIVNISYSSDHQTLIIAYANGNIDLLKHGNVVNISDIYRKVINASKTVHDILIFDGYAYLSCGFGIVKLNLDKHEIADTYIIGNNATPMAVLSLCVVGDYFYATAEGGIYQAATSGTNLLNYANWHLLSDMPNSSLNVKAVSYNQALYLLQKDGQVYRQQPGFWQPLYTNISNITESNNILFLAQTGVLTCIGQSGTTTIALSHPQMASFDEQTQLLWIAASSDGVVRTNLNGTDVNIFKPSGPGVNTIFRMRYSDGKIVAVNGGRWAGAYNRFGYVMFFEDGRWTNFSSDDIRLSLPNNRYCYDLIDVAIDPNDNSHFFVSSYQTGIYEFRQNRPYILYNNDNSGVESISPNSKPDFSYYHNHRVDGLALDKKNRLWFINGLTTSTLKYMEPDPDGNGPLVGEVHPMNYPALQGVSTASEIIISSFNQNLKFVLVPRRTTSSNTGLFAFDDKGTLDNLTDDVSLMRTSFVNQDGEPFAPNNFRCFVEDKDGALWIGASAGIIVLGNATRFFENNFRGTQPKIPRNDGSNLADYLLKNEQINAIAVDGANRKWIGTAASGVYLVSPDGTETIHHFTSENSPLLNNHIISICINEQTGEVFFGTELGLISFQSDAIEGGDKFDNVHAFPNPVRETYHGPITITGLIADTRVKITDINGNLVYETISNGGVATWDGKRKGGERVATGIYLAICVSADGMQNAITKILFIN